MRLKGGALYITVMISVVVGIILLMLLMLARFNDSYLNSAVLSKQLELDCKSAEVLARSVSHNTYAGKWINLFDNKDSVRFLVKPWGAFQLLNIEAKNKSGQKHYVGFYGTFMKRDTGLVVEQSAEYIGVSGQIQIKANSFMSTRGLKPAYIDGQSYVPDGNSEKYIMKSGGVAVCNMDKDFINKLILQRFPSSDENDTVFSSDNVVVSRSFKTKTHRVNGVTLLIKNMTIIGNMKYIASKEIIIDSTAILKDVLVIAPVVKIQKGFKGNIHVIANDSILVGERVLLEYPSSLNLLNEQSNSNGLKVISIGNDAVVQGSIIAYDTQRGVNSSKVMVQCHSKSTVIGLLFCNGYVHLSGNIYANIYSRQLLLKTSSGVYENHMLSCIIDPGKYSAFVAIPSINAKNKLFKCKSAI